MAVYQYQARDLVTKQLLGFLPLKGVTYTESLNSVGSLTASIDLGGRTQAMTVGAVEVGSRRLSETYLSAVIPGRTAIYPLRDGQAVIGGPYLVTDEPVKMMGDRNWSIRAASMWSYFYERTLNVTKKYLNQDQATIARGLVTYAQSIAGGNIGVVVPVSTTGVLRTQDYFGYERKTIGDLVQQLAALDNGFDFAITTQMVDEEPVSTFRVFYPRRGARATETGIVFNGGSFTLEKNLRDYSVSAGLQSMVTSIHAIGAGEDTSMLISTSTDTAMVSQGYPIREATVSYKDVVKIATLKAHADADRKARARQLKRWLLDVDPDDVSVPFGSWQVGDDVRVIIGDDERFPGGVDVTLRIVEQTVRVNDDGGPDIVLLTMGDPFG